MRAAPRPTRHARILPFVTPFFLPRRLPITAALQNVKPWAYLTTRFLSLNPLPRKITRSQLLYTYLSPLSPPPVADWFLSPLLFFFSFFNYLDASRLVLYLEVVTYQRGFLSISYLIHQPSHTTHHVWT
jgi:hypothetical protein